MEHLVIFLVTSQTRHILSRGSSFFRAVLCMMINIVIMKLVTTTAMMRTVMTTLTIGSTCMMAVSKPGSHAEIGMLKSAAHPSSWP